MMDISTIGPEGLITLFLMRTMRVKPAHKLDTAASGVRKHSKLSTDHSSGHGLLCVQEVVPEV